MHILEDVDLRFYSTMRLGGRAKYLSEVTNEQDLPRLLDWAKEKSCPFMMIGVGSNIIWKDEGFDGLVIVNGLRGREILSENETELVVRVAGGEIWDDLVGWSVDSGWGGLELLSLIPGTVGAAPVQNVGAYGGELSKVLVEVEVYDTQTGSFEGILKESCDFSYRNSRFKTKDRGRFMITAVVLRLNKDKPKPPFYESLQTYLDDNKISDFSPKSIREAVIAIRSSKLPDPAKVANNGSFFTNPFVTEEKYNELKEKFPEIKGWPTDNGQFKLAAGWLVEEAGFKGTHDQETGMATWEKQALVLVNEHAKKTSDLLTFRQKILDKVREKFGVKLEQEPELLP